MVAAEGNMKYILYPFIVIVCCFSATAQDTTVVAPSYSESDSKLKIPGVDRSVPVYKLKPAVDIPITAIGAGWSIYAFGKIYSKDPIPLDVVQNLDKNDVNGFDRWGAGLTSKKAAEVSDLFFYGSMPFPLILMFDRHIRKDAGKIGFLYLESMAITGLLYTGSTYLTNRYRPETYAESIPAEDRTRGGNKNSFFAGHVALVGTSTFFVAKVFSDYHPGSPLNYVFYGAAIASTGATAYLRHRAGKHFPSDIVVGLAVGTLSGILVPHLHKNKIEEPRLSFKPYLDMNMGLSQGIKVAYRLK
jgi:membrane-associated phospholipid phosphatase